MSTTHGPSSHQPSPFKFFFEIQSYWNPRFILLSAFSLSNFFIGMEAKSRTLEITVLSGEDLRIDNKSVKKNAFVVVSVDPFNSMTTKMDGEGGSYPSWNDKLVMNMPMQTRFVSLQVKCKASGKEKTVGFARIPVTDFIGGYSPETCLQFLSYRLRDPKGLKNGIINVSVRVKEPLHACSSQAAAAGRLGISIDGRKDLGVVTGIPIWSTGYPSILCLDDFTGIQLKLTSKLYKTHT